MHLHLLAFIGVAALLTITPGADMAVVTRIALARGRRAAWLTSLGIINGLLCWAIAAALGLAALLNASATAFTVLKLAGAAYLILMGIQTLWRTRPSVIWASAEPEADPGIASRQGGWSAYRQGLLSNLLNPKIAVFYTTFLPQFMAPGDPVFATSLLLAGIHMSMGLIWLFAYTFLVTRAGDVLRRPRIKTAMERVTGTVLIGFGLRLGLAR
jgi:threonine/homoserine/homoserine lactone efflux protein